MSDPTLSADTQEALRLLQQPAGASKVPHPDQDPDFWDVIRLKPIPTSIQATATSQSSGADIGAKSLPVVAFVLPGVWDLRVSHRVNVDFKKTKGAAGARLIDHGDDPAEIELIGEIGTPADWYAFQDILPTLNPPKKSTHRLAFEINCAMASLHGISKCWLAPPEFEHPKNNLGILKIRIVGYEWFEQPAIKKPAEKPPNAPANGSAQTSTTQIESDNYSFDPNEVAG